MTYEEQAIAGVLKQYEAALNASSTDAVIALYAHDGVFMPQGSPSAVGSEALRTAYDAVFAALTLRVTFDIVEVKQTGSEWGFARTNSSGKSTVHATNTTGTEGNQELFIFQRVGGAWKIARYCFSTTQSN